MAWGSVEKHHNDNFSLYLYLYCNDPGPDSPPSLELTS